MFGRATITLGIGPHSSNNYVFKCFYWSVKHVSILFFQICVLITMLRASHGAGWLRTSCTDFVAKNEWTTVPLLRCHAGGVPEAGLKAVNRCGVKNCTAEDLG